MSSAGEEDGTCRGVKRRLVRWMWTIFPHVVPLASLIGYALFGAWVFHNIEGKASNGRRDEDYRRFVRQVVEIVRNRSAQPEEDLLPTVEKQIMNNYQAVWSQSPQRWDFYGSLFFCCTIFSTVGYGEIYPVTQTGRAVSILYAMVGIPLMLLVITDVGDILARVVSNAYQTLHSSFKRLLSRVPCQKSGIIHDVTFTFSQDSEAGKPLDIHQVMHSQSSVKNKSTQLVNNIKIFESIIAREKFGQDAPLTRSCSCPELNQMPPPPLDFRIFDFSSIGQEMERFDVPFLLILFVVFAYILSWALILPQWETHLTIFEAFYFCFITLTTIGLGDIVPKHPKFFLLTFFFIITGMAIMSMAFKLSQTRIISFYHKFTGCLNCLGVGKTTKHEVQKVQQEVKEQPLQYL
ncbi:potassium channel subfamily K member 18 [Trichomycterus rosablanca]|uniref:potassium channel subfamily K member 18 n=1 Tax=Trichomycterus rosablanca TaxID=2290929 RepID=UPI002F3575E3